MYDTIDSILESGLALGKIRVLLDTLHGVKGKEANELIEDAGIESKRSNAFVADYYAWLVESQRTAQEAEDYINGVEDLGYTETSDNVKRHLKAHFVVWTLANAIHESYQMEEAA